MTPLEANPETAQEEWAELERLALAANVEDERDRWTDHADGGGWTGYGPVGELGRALAANPSTVLALIAAARGRSVGIAAGDAARRPMEDLGDGRWADVEPAPNPSRPTTEDVARVIREELNHLIDPAVLDGSTTRAAARILDLLPTGEGWRPIETAPRDGTRLLLWDSKREVAVSGCWHHEAGRDDPGGHEPSWSWWVSDNDTIMWDDGPDDKPTFWTPFTLPPAPSIAGEGRPAPKTEGGQP